MSQQAGEYFFKFQFFIHNLHLTKDFFNVIRPAVAIRFLDFPTLAIQGDLTPDGRLMFNKGKSTSFKMDSDELKRALENKPFYVMFIDSQPEK